MRSINIFLVTLLPLFSAIVFGQNETYSGPYKLPKYFGQPHDTYINNDVILLNYSPYVGVLNPSLIKYGLYRYASLKSSGEFTDIKIPTKQGIIKNCYYSGDTITEFVLYFKKGFPKYQYSYAIRRRSCKTMEVLGEEKKLTDYQYRDVEDHEYAQLLYNGTEFVFVEMTRKNGEITFLTNDFEEINKVQLTEQALSSVENKHHYLPIFNADGSILLVFPTWNTNPQIPLTEEKNTIFHISPESEIHSFTTKFADSDAYLISNSSFNYTYDPEKKEISWCYGTNSNTTPKQSGLGIAKWDLEGNLLSNTHMVLDFETIFDNEPEIKEWFNSVEISPEEFWITMVRFGYFSFVTADDGGTYITLQKKRINSDPGLKAGVLSSYFIKVDRTGKILWVKLFVTSPETPYWYLGNPYLKDGKIHILAGDKDFTQNAGITFSEISLDPKDGSEKNNKRLHVTLEADEVINTIVSNENRDKISLEIRKGKTVSYKTINLE